MERITKPRLVRLIQRMKDDQTRRSLIAILLKDGTLTEDDLAAFAAQEIEEHLDRFLAALKEDRLLQFYWERFKDYPQYLARALARLRPDLFYTYGLAFRFILKLRTDLGMVVLPPHRPGDEPLGVEPMPALVREIRQDLFALDLECRFREFLYFFSVNIVEGRALLDEEIARTSTDYDREVLTAVRERVAELLDMEFPGIVPTLNGRPFPALHVRWWIAQAHDIPRCLNIGGTGTYKTSFATLMMCRDPREHILVLCAPHARKHWSREMTTYFRKPPAIRVIQRAKELRSRSDALFTVVGYSTLIRPDAVEELLAQSFDGLIMDECQYGKGVIGSESQRATRAVASQRLARELPLKRFIALSATPWENRPDELAAIATALRPDLFPTPEQFLKSGAGQSPRFLRELFADQVLEIELREISDLPPITPKPWEDLCGAEPIVMTPEHAALYRFVRDLEPEDGDEGPSPIQKVQLLLQAAIHPHLLERHMDWPDELRIAFRDWRLSTKLRWLREFVSTHIDNAKIVIGTGIYVEGITRLENGDVETAFVDRLLREWFGTDHVLTIDGTVSAHANGSGKSPRDALIERWRTDPTVRVLLVSMRACPDSVNLTIPKTDGIMKLWVTTLSFGWKPWEQFLGRYWREGQGVPVEYRVPILVDSIDEDLLRLNQEKWRVQRLFRAQVPLSESEWGLLRKSGIQQLGTLLRSSVKEVHRITSMMRGRGENGCATAYATKDGMRTNAELFAEHFVRIQEYAGSGHISRFLSRAIDEFVKAGLIRDERCLDAGCGPLTMARRRNTPWHSIDMNPHMIAAGRQLAGNLAEHARVGFLSELPEEWTGRFDLVVASLVLHFSSRSAVRHAEPERLRILRELTRVTNPHGLLWLMWNEGYQTDETFLSWVEGFTREGFTMHPLSGLVHATEAPTTQPFRCWSLLVSPDGHVPTFASTDPFRFPFELTRRKMIHGRDPDRDRPPPKDTRERKAYQYFEVRDVRTRTATADIAAARTVAVAEFQRIVAAANAGKTIDRKLHGVPQELASNWRVIEELQRRGILDLRSTA